jgi:hypothetical protein
VSPSDVERIIKYVACALITAPDYCSASPEVFASMFVWATTNRLGKLIPRSPQPPLLARWSQDAVGLGSISPVVVSASCSL